jgi:hypothetical protein
VLSRKCQAIDLKLDEVILSDGRCYQNHSHSGVVDGWDLRIGQVGQEDF